MAENRFLKDISIEELQRNAELVRKGLQGGRTIADTDIGKEFAARGLDPLTGNALGQPKVVQPPTQLVSQAPPLTTQPSQAVAQQPDRFNEFLKELSSARRQAAVSGIEQAALKSRQAVEQERALIPEQFKTQRTGIKTQSQLGGESFKKFLQRRGLEGSGAASQAEIARMSTLQSGLGQSTLAEEQAQQQASRRLQDIETQRQFGLQQAEAGIAGETAQQQLARLGQLEQRDFQSEQARIGREFDLAKLQQSQAFSEQQRINQNLNDQDMLLLRNDLDRENAVLDTQLLEARADNNLIRERQILADKEQIAARQLALESDARMQQIRLQTSGSLSQIGARGAQDRATAEFRQGLEGTQVDPKEELRQFGAAIQQEIIGGNTDKAQSALNTNAQSIIQNFGISEFNRLQGLIDAEKRRQGAGLEDIMSQFFIER